MSSQWDEPVVVAPMPIPWTATETIDHDKLARNVQRWSATSLSGLVVGSAAGEEQYLSEADKIDAMRTVIDARRHGLLVIGGIDCPSTYETIRRATAMVEAGADTLRIRIPQGRGGTSTCHSVEYYKQVAREIPVPLIVIHQTWQTGGHAATPEEISEICSIDSVFAYICWHDLRFESLVRRLAPASVPFWAPNGSLLLPAALIGATGACAFLANWAPDLVREIMRLGIAGEFTKAQPIQRKILRADFLGMTYGVAALKAGLNLLGYEATIPRRPQPPLDAAAVDQHSARPTCYEISDLRMMRQ